MAGQTFLFIDGNYLRQRHREAMLDFFGVEGDLDLFPMLRLADASRAYFYDAIDYSQRLNETETAYKARVLERERFFSHVQSLRGFHVRPGTVRHSKKREQKEIDVLLAVDMMSHGFRGTMSSAVLVAGDVDLRPAVEELVRQGVFVNVWYHRNSVARELPDAADFAYEIKFRDLHSWNSETFKNAHPIPWEQHLGGGPYGTLLKTGSVDGFQAELYSHPDQQLMSLWLTFAPGVTTWIRDRDEKLIERYVAAQYGPVKWEVTGDEIVGLQS